MKNHARACLFYVFGLLLLFSRGIARNGRNHINPESGCACLGLIDSMLSLGWRVRWSCLKA